MVQGLREQRSQSICVGGRTLFTTRKKPATEAHDYSVPTQYDLSHLPTGMDSAIVIHEGRRLHCTVCPRHCQLRGRWILRGTAPTALFDSQFGRRRRFHVHSGRSHGQFENHGTVPRCHEGGLRAYLRQWFHATLGILFRWWWRCCYYISGHCCSAAQQDRECGTF